MSRVISPVSGKPYGLAAVCRAWRLARSGVYRHQRTMLQPQRRGPLGAMSDDGLTAAIQGVLAASPFHGEGHRKVWARLRYAGTRTSMRRVLRLMRQNNLLAPTRVGSPRGPRNHDGTIIPDTVDAMWGTDLTTTITGEGQATVFIAVDHCSAECVGIHAMNTVRSEEHTSELQSQSNLVCRLLLEKKKKNDDMLKERLDYFGTI